MNFATILSVYEPITAPKETKKEETEKTATKGIDSTVTMAKPSVSERGKIDSFIVMDLMRDATAKQRELEASGVCVCV